MLLGFAFVAEVYAADELAHDDEVNAFDKFRFERGILDKGIRDFYRTQVGVKAEVLAQAEDGLLRTQGRVDIVPFVAADSTEEDAVGCLAGLNRIFRQRRAEFIVSRAACILIRIGKAEAEFFIDFLEDLHCRIRDFFANAVARDYCDFICHNATFFIFAVISANAIRERNAPFSSIILYRRKQSIPSVNFKPAGS